MYVSGLIFFGVISAGKFNTMIILKMFALMIFSIVMSFLFLRIFVIAVVSFGRLVSIVIVVRFIVNSLMVK